MRSLGVVFVCVVALCRAADKCPALDETESFYKDKEPFNAAKSAENNQGEEEAIKKFGADTIERMKSSDKCSKPDIAQSLSRTPTSCEPCPETAYHLHTFNHGNCYVLYPHIHRIRYARCSYRSCSQFCPCGNKYCKPYGWAKMWFLGFCFRPQGNWQAGFNYNYILLPQDCKCS